MAENVREVNGMERGEKVEAETFDHKTIQARVVEVHGTTAIICSEREWQAAARQRRDPDCVGWPVASVRAVSGLNAVPE
jgi:hypothetical protein